MAIHIPRLLFDARLSGPRGFTHGLIGGFVDGTEENGFKNIVLHGQLRCEGADSLQRGC